MDGKELSILCNLFGCREINRKTRKQESFIYDELKFNANSFSAKKKKKKGTDSKCEMSGFSSCFALGTRTPFSLGFFSSSLQNIVKILAINILLLREKRNKKRRSMYPYEREFTVPWRQLVAVVVVVGEAAAEMERFGRQKEVLLLLAVKP